MINARQNLILDDWWRLITMPPSLFLMNLHDIALCGRAAMDMEITRSKSNPKKTVKYKQGNIQYY